MTVGNQLYSNLSLLARQSMLMLTDLPEMVTVFERFFQLECSESYTCNMHGDARIEGYHYCMPLETLLALNYNSFILTVGIIGVDSHARDMYGNSHSQGTCVLLEIPFIHKLLQYFQRPYSCRNEDIIYTSLKVYVLPTLKLIFVQEFLNTVVHLSNVNSLYQCSCKQCCAIAVYAMCYSVINPCGYWTSGTLSALASNGNTLYNVMSVKRHIMPTDLPESESISGVQINLTVFAVRNGVLCCNLAESKSVLKMCISKHCHEVTGFLSWIGTYRISCLVQQRSRVKDLSFLVGCDES